MMKDLIKNLLEHSCKRRGWPIRLYVDDDTQLEETVTNYEEQLIEHSYHEIFKWSAAIDPQQVKKWQVVSNAVHEKGGKVFMQIWHVGRVSHPTFLQGELPISSSATIIQGRIPRSKGLCYGESREASLDDIQVLIEAYAQAAKNAIEAGFDGVEIHGASGYLIDQFLHYHTNLREDQYGESAESMSCFALEVVLACGDVVGFDRVGIWLSPGGYFNEIVGDPRDY